MKHSGFARFSWAVLAYTIAVILWGAFVRATGSGAGCGSNWPLCNGQVIPRAPEIETLIEFTHRATSGLAGILVLVLVIWAFRSFPRGSLVRWGAVFSLIFMVTEGLIGAALVLFELVADNASMARALFMGVHLLNTFILLAALALTAWWASGGPPFSIRRQGVHSWLFGLGLAGLLWVSSSGAVAALGDTLFPSGSLEEALREDLSLTSHLLIRLRLLHPFLALAVSGFLVGGALLSALLRPGPAIWRWAQWVLLLVIVQLTAGLINVLLLAPVWLQLVHLLLADLLWLAWIFMAATVLATAEPRRTLSDAAPERIRSQAAPTQVL